MARSGVCVGAEHGAAVGEELAQLAADVPASPQHCEVLLPGQAALYEPAQVLGELHLVCDRTEERVPIFAGAMAESSPDSGLLAVDDQPEVSGGACYCGRNPSS